MCILGKEQSLWNEAVRYRKETVKDNGKRENRAFYFGACMLCRDTYSYTLSCKKVRLAPPAHRPKRSLYDAWLGHLEIHPDGNGAAEEIARPHEDVYAARRPCSAQSIIFNHQYYKRTERRDYL